MSWLTIDSWIFQTVHRGLTHEYFINQGFERFGKGLFTAESKLPIGQLMMQFSDHDLEFLLLLSELGFQIVTMLAYDVE